MKRLLLGLMCFAVLSLGSCRAFHKWNADFINDINQEYQVQDARGRIANYEWFYDQYAAIQATKQKVEILSGKPEQDGVRMVLASMIEEYNARARMITTKGQWKASDLPSEIKGGK